MAWIVRSLLLSCFFLAAACSMEAAINTFSSPEDRAFAQRFVEDVRTGNEAALKPEFDPSIWEKSRPQLANARPLFPPGKGSTRLVGFHVATNTINGDSSTRKEFVLVTTDQTHWTRTEIVTFARNGPPRVVGWNVDGFKEPPPDLKMYETMERIAPWLQAAGVIIFISIAAFIWWLVRRSRRRRVAGG